MIKSNNSMLAVVIFLSMGALVSCGETEENKAQQAADKRLQAEADCASLARDKTGYNPSGQSSTSSSIGKGAAIGAAGGAAVGAITASNKKKKKTSKKVVQGAAIGAAAGAGIAAISDNDKKNADAQSRDVYQREYQDCLKGKGF